MAISVLLVHPQKEMFENPEEIYDGLMPRN